MSQDPITTPEQLAEAANHATRPMTAEQLAEAANYAKKPTSTIVTPVQRVLSKAKHYVDVKYKEGADNDTIFGQWYGANHQPWCAMFVSKVFNEAGLSKIVAATTAKGFASCQLGLNWFVKKRQVVPVASAQAGDIAFYQFDADPASDHVGIVVKNNKLRKTLVTYEGNTAADGSGSQSNGNGVYQKTRSYSEVMAVARPAYPA